MLGGLRPLLLVVMLLPGPALAGKVENMIVSQLKDQGFTQIEINRTWLGRSHIVAKSKNYTREIVVNPSTGAIMRDYWQEVNTVNAVTGLIDPNVSSISEDDDGDSSGDSSGDSGDDGDGDGDGDSGGDSGGGGSGHGDGGSSGHGSGDG